MDAHFKISWTVQQRFPLIDVALEDLMTHHMRTYIDPDDGHVWFQAPAPHEGLRFQLENTIARKQATQAIAAWRHFQKER